MIVKYEPQSVKSKQVIHSIVESTLAMTTTLNPYATPILIDAMSWQEFKTVEPLLDRPGVRLSFLDGVLEIRHMPGEQHETVKERIGTLLDLYLLQLGIDYTPTGSMTLENESGLVKREADKSYKLGANRPYPDLAIEVVVTSGGLDKLDAYCRLNIPEVWFWEDGTLAIFHLSNSGDRMTYQRASDSRVLPNLDMELFLRCVNMDNHLEAVREFQRNLQAS